MKRNIKIDVKVSKVSCSKDKVSYQSKFLKNKSMQKRGDKAIYVKAEYHEKLMRISCVVGNGKLPLYAYLDNIIKHHFELYGNEITAEFNDKNKPLF